MSGTRIMAQKTSYPKIRKLQKKHESTTGGLRSQTKNFFAV